MLWCAAACVWCAWQVDARGVPSRLAAVLYLDGLWHYTDGAPSAEIMKRFVERADNQITSLEMLAISMAIATFSQELHGRKVIVWSDNSGAEAATVKGAAKAWDHNQVIHEVWYQALENRTWLWIERVPSDDNVADLPSREEYQLLQDLSAAWRAPLVAKACA